MVSLSTRVRLRKVVGNARFAESSFTELCRGGRDNATFAFLSPPRKSPEPFRVRLLSNEKAGLIFVVDIRERPLIAAVERQKEQE
jgi:hypothetical protein